MSRTSVLDELSANEETFVSTSPIPRGAGKEPRRKMVITGPDRLVAALGEVLMAYGAARPAKAVGGRGKGPWTVFPSKYGEAQVRFEGQIVAIFPTLGGQWATSQSFKEARSRARRLATHLNTTGFAVRKGKW